MLAISLTRFNRFRDSLPSGSEPPRKYVEQYRTVQEFERLRDYLHHVGEQVAQVDGEDVVPFRGALSGSDGQIVRATGVSRGRQVLRLDLESDNGVQCRYHRSNGKQNWTVAGPQGSTIFQLDGDRLSVRRSLKGPISPHTPL